MIKLYSYWFKDFYRDKNISFSCRKIIYSLLVSYRIDRHRKRKYFPSLI